MGRKGGKGKLERKKGKEMEKTMKKKVQQCARVNRELQVTTPFSNESYIKNNTL